MPVGYSGLLLGCCGFYSSNASRRFLGVACRSIYDFFGVLVFKDMKHAYFTRSSIRSRIGNPQAMGAVCGVLSVLRRDRDTKYMSGH